MAQLPRKPPEPHAGAPVANSEQAWDMLREIFLSPAMAMSAQPPTRNLDALGIWGKIHKAIDPVQAFGGYGATALMGLGAAQPIPRMKPTHYHYSQYDFEKAKPSSYRQAVYFADNPEGAIRGASAGGMEHPALGGPAGSGKKAGPLVYPVRVSGKVWGRDPMPKSWLPKKISYSEFRKIVDGTDGWKPPAKLGLTEGQARTAILERREWARKAYTEAVPESQYHKYRGENEGKLPLKLQDDYRPEPHLYSDIEGESANAFINNPIMTNAEKRAFYQKLGYGGVTITDEAGKGTIAMFRPGHVTNTLTRRPFY